MPLKSITVSTLTETQAFYCRESSFGLSFGSGALYHAARAKRRLLP